MDSTPATMPIRMIASRRLGGRVSVMESASAAGAGGSPATAVGASSLGPLTSIHLRLHRGAMPPPGWYAADPGCGASSSCYSRAHDRRQPHDHPPQDPGPNDTQPPGARGGLGDRPIHDPTSGRRGPGFPVAERAAAGGWPASGRRARVTAPSSSPKGRDPVAIILAQEADRLQDLLPLRHGRMAASAFAFYRGAPAVMAFDLSTTPRSDIIVQASGDAHLSNFGLFASPERTLVFDSNDFDETIPGPWEWDVKRLAASVVIASRTNGFSRSEARARPSWRRSAATASRWPRYAGMRLLDIWYDQTTADDIEVRADRRSAASWGRWAARRTLARPAQRASSRRPAPRISSRPWAR